MFGMGNHVSTYINEVEIVEALKDEKRIKFMYGTESKKETERGREKKRRISFCARKSCTRCISCLHYYHHRTPLPQDRTLQIFNVRQHLWKTRIGKANEKI